MKTENYHQDPSSLPPLHRRRRSRRNKKSQCTHHPRNQQQKVWVPAIPSWEKEFCLKNLGFFTWEEFLEVKRYIKLNVKVMEWDDSGAEEAFNSAKNRFFAAKQLCPDDDENSRYYLKKLPDDLYIDEINWDDDNQEEDPDDIPDTISQQEEEDDQVVEIFEVNIDDIKPTGWDIDLEHVYDFLKPPDLTGLVVGN